MKKYQKLFRENLKSWQQDYKGSFLYCGIDITKLSKEDLLVVTYKLLEDEGFTIED